MSHKEREQEYAEGIAKARYSDNVFEYDVFVFDNKIVLN